MITTFENFAYNEGVSLNKETIEKALAVVKKKMPFDTFVKYLKKHKDKVKWLVKHFTNGKDTVYTSKLFVKNEGFKDTWIYELFVEPFAEWSYNDWTDRAMSGLVWIMALLVGVLIYILGIIIYVNFIYTPMDRGVVRDVEFSAAHSELVTTYVSVGKTMIPVTNTVHYPDTWNVEVKQIGGSGVEGWSTTSISVGQKLSKGDTISWNDAIYNVNHMKTKSVEPPAEKNGW